MNLIFVIGFHMEAEGVAIASVMASTTSAVWFYIICGDGRMSADADFAGVFSQNGG